MVTEVKARFPDVVTLAIGDGANDTDMITEAHIGVGISGVEGTAATNSADYAVGNFRFLHSLLFRHGYWNYQRVSFLVNFIFYKAMLLACTMYLFSWLSGFSGQQLFNDAMYQQFNVFYTSLPVIAVAILDQPMNGKVLEDNPFFYRDARGRAFSLQGFLGWLLRALVHAAACCFIPLLSLRDTVHLGGLWMSSSLALQSNMLVATFLILFEVHSGSLVFWLALLSGPSRYIFFAILLSNSLSYNPSYWGVTNETWFNLVPWLVTLLTVGVCMLMELTIRAFFHGQTAREVYLARRESDKKTSKATKVGPSDTPQNYAIEMAKKSVRDVGRVRADTLEATHTESEPRSDDGLNEHMRAAIVGAMLRMRNSTGSIFDSSAQAKLQTHDSMAPEKRPEKSQKRSTTRATTKRSR
jgi:magnesium-transporting ATPase (P-type)